jgi:hypothetical protein|tara:strand:+ start:108 stop:413 length:306 start_codon:yes stop_codon:yes gene_type:complete
MIVTSENTNHSLKIVPRYYPCNPLTLTISDSAVNSSVDITPSYYESNNKLVIKFDYTFTENSRYRVSLTDTSNNEVVYRGKLIMTTQETQEFKLTTDKFYY